MTLNSMPRPHAKNVIELIDIEDQWVWWTGSVQHSLDKYCWDFCSICWLTHSLTDIYLLLQTMVMSVPNDHCLNSMLIYGVMLKYVGPLPVVGFLFINYVCRYHLTQACCKSSLNVASFISFCSWTKQYKYLYSCLETLHSVFQYLTLYHGWLFNTTFNFFCTNWFH